MGLVIQKGSFLKTLSSEFSIQVCEPTQEFTVPCTSDEQQSKWEPNGKGHILCMPEKWRCLHNDSNRFFCFSYSKFICSSGSWKHCKTTLFWKTCEGHPYGYTRVWTDVSTKQPPKRHGWEKSQQSDIHILQPALLWLNCSVVIAPQWMVCHALPPWPWFYPNNNLSHTPAFHLLIECRSLAGANLLLLWSLTNHAFHQNWENFSRFSNMLIHMGHLGIPRGSSNTSMSRLGPKAPQEVKAIHRSPYPWVSG